MVAWVTKALDKVRRRTLDRVGGGDRNAAVAPGGTPAGSAFAGSAGVGFDFVTDDRGFVTEPGTWRVCRLGLRCRAGRARAARA